MRWSEERVVGVVFTHCVCTAVAVCCCKCNSWACSGPGAGLAHRVWPSVTGTMAVAAKCVRYLMDEESSSSSSVAARATGTTGRDELTAVAAARRLLEKRRQRTPPSTSDAKTHGRQSPALRARKEIFYPLPLAPCTFHAGSTVEPLLVPPCTHDDILMMIHCDV